MFYILTSYTCQQRRLTWYLRRHVNRNVWFTGLAFIVVYHPVCSSILRRYRVYVIKKFRGLNFVRPLSCVRN
jgi:hypothetical protein